MCCVFYIDKRNEEMGRLILTLVQSEGKGVGEFGASVGRSQAKSGVSRRRFAFRSDQNAYQVQSQADLIVWSPPSSLSS